MGRYELVRTTAKASWQEGIARDEWSVTYHFPASLSAFQFCRPEKHLLWKLCALPKTFASNKTLCAVSLSSNRCAFNSGISLILKYEVIKTERKYNGITVDQLPSLHCTVIVFASVWRRSDSSPLAYLRDCTWELYVGAFLHCKELEDLLRALGLWCCENWGIGENEKVKAVYKLIPLQKRAFRGCCWNRGDVILFVVVWKFTASRENCRELLGDEVMKTASHRNCTLQVTSIEFEQRLQGRKWEFVFTLQRHLVD